jgi:ribonuclease Z
MAELLLLGTAGAFGDGSRDPTSLALRGPGSTIVIDCGGNPLRQLQRLGVPLDSVDRLILTHAHVDHTSGLPLLLKMLWHAGRRAPLPIHGPAHTLDIARPAMALWPSLREAKLFRLDWQPVPLEPGVTVAQTDDFEIYAAPGQHTVPVIGLRVRDRRGGGTLAYSADGEPSRPIRDLAQNVDLLVHEANGPGEHHSSAEQAAEVARAADARRLLLVHLRPQEVDLPAALAAAQAIFHGEVVLGDDLQRFEF